MIARHEHQPASCAPRWLSRLRIILLALATTHTIWAFTYWFTGIDLRLRNGDATVGALNVLAATLVAGGVAWLVAEILDRFVRRAKTAWTFGCCLSLGGSLLGPLTAAATTSATIVLGVMHVAVAAILIVGMRQTLRDREA